MSSLTEINDRINEHKEYLIKAMPVYKLESALIDCIQSKLNDGSVISRLFDDNVDFQEWISGVRDELCEWIAIADVNELSAKRNVLRSNMDEWEGTKGPFRGLSFIVLR